MNGINLIIGNILGSVVSVGSKLNQILQLFGIWSEDETSYYITEDETGYYVSETLTE